ncbi:hypothetical protein RHGRI_016148 [Rhododendron griersonianum]|uniref:Allene oxide synthase n=1 Tax=Rhododendron griersonianum TaxID=479676 RepID=A0AAV6JTF3_9ERIC|nr:hypothetical protein RHGRI_016148 [Rhododendron griersonianum]
MASTSLAFPSLHLQFPSQRSPNLTSRHPTHRLIIRASVSSEKPSPLPPLSTAAKAEKPKSLPIRKIPGNYGLPLIGPLRDRLDYFYNQGRDDYFKSRIQKYQSTVFRANMPPGPFIAANPNVVVLLDGKSFPVLFDVTKVEKKDLFTGTYMPSVDLTGGHRVLSYLDPSEPSHGKLKRLMFFLLKSSRDRVIPEFHDAYTALFETLESDLAQKGKSSFGDANDQAAFNFLAGSLYGTNPADTQLKTDGPKLVSKWVLFQLGPLLTLGLPKLIEELTVHSFRLPPSLVKNDYKRLYDFFYNASTPILEEAERIGWIGRAGVKLHTELAQEIRSVVRSNGGEVTMGAMEKMELMKSVVYESLRIEPPVPLQFGRAKRDMVIESHDAAFEVREGEMLFGFQPFATKDPKIFERSEEFVPGRFVGEEGEGLLRHVLWSNGPETESPTAGNKQCAGKDFVVLVSRLLVVEFFLRYDSFEIEVGKSPLGAKVTVTSYGGAGEVINCTGSVARVLLSGSFIHRTFVAVVQEHRMITRGQ